MKTRTSIVMAAVAAGLALFIYFFEQHQPTTGELEERTDRVLPGFDRERVDQVMLGQGDARIELVRQSSPTEEEAAPGAVGRWRLQHPLAADADPEAVDNLLSAIDWLERRRAIEENNAVAEPRYGLVEPRRVVTFRLRGREVALKVGADAPGGKVYLAVGGDDDRVLVVDHDFLDAVSKEAGELRDKQLLHADGAEAEALRVAGQFHAERVGESDRWVLTTPVKLRAASTKIQDVLRELEQLRATRFVADQVDEQQLSAYGLGAPQAEVTVRFRGGPGRFVLRVGSPCEGHAEDLYATVVSSGTVACVPRDFLEKVQVDPQSLRDPQLTALTAGELRSVTLQRGSEELVLTPQESRWHVGGAEGPEADEETVSSLLGSLRETAAEVAAAAPPAEVGLGGEQPAADVKVTLRPSDEQASEEVLLFNLRPQGAWVRRAGEDLALAVPSTLSAVLVTDPLHYANRELLELDAGQAREVEVVAGRDRQVLRQAEGEWRLVEPVSFAADQSAVNDLVRAVAGLRVERFVGARAQAAQGLKAPSIQLTVAFGASEGAGADASSETGEMVRLRIGAQTEGGWFAQREGGDSRVFVLAETFVRSLERPLIDPNLLAVEQDRVVGLVIDKGPSAPRVELEKGEQGWLRAGQAAPAEEVEALLGQLATARASKVVGFGEPGPETGLRQPRARVVMRLQTPGGPAEERVLLVGADFGSGDNRGVYVRRPDVGVTFALPAGIVQSIVDYDQQEPQGAASGGSSGADA